jgi:hypothetical protein
VPPPNSPPQIDLESIFKDVLTRADVSQEVEAIILALARTFEIIPEARVQSIQTGNDWCRITVISPYAYRGRFQSAEFSFPPNSKHFENELKRLAITGKPFTLHFYRAIREEDNEITQVYVFDNSIKIVGL